MIDCEKCGQPMTWHDCTNPDCEDGFYYDGDEHVICETCDGTSSWPACDNPECNDPTIVKDGNCCQKDRE